MDFYNGAYYWIFDFLLNVFLPIGKEEKNLHFFFENNL
jgi:hypothetical protein